MPESSQRANYEAEGLIYGDAVYRPKGLFTKDDQFTKHEKEQEPLSGERVNNRVVSHMCSWEEKQPAENTKEAEKPKKKCRFHLRCYTGHHLPFSHQFKMTVAAAVGQPKVGNRHFQQAVNKFLPDYWRVTNEGDPAPTVFNHLALASWSYIPGCISVCPTLYLDTCCTKWQYHHAGKCAHLKLGGQVRSGHILETRTRG